MAVMIMTFFTNQSLSNHQSLSTSLKFSRGNGRPLFLVLLFLIQNAVRIIRQFKSLPLILFLILFFILGLNLI